MRSLSPSLIALTLFVACGHADDVTPLGSLEQPIVNGEASNETTDDGVVYILTSPPGLSPTRCSGALIAPNLVATALHCVTYTELGFFSCNADGTVEERSGHFFNADLRITKGFMLGERARVKVYTDLFNLFNSENLSFAAS